MAIMAGLFLIMIAGLSIALETGASIVEVISYIVAASLIVYSTNELVTIYSSATLTVLLALVASIGFSSCNNNEAVIPDDFQRIQGSWALQDYNKNMVLEFKGDSIKQIGVTSIEWVVKQKGKFILTNGSMTMAYSNGRSWTGPYVIVSDDIIIIEGYAVNGDQFNRVTR